MCTGFIVLAFKWRGLCAFVIVTLPGEGQVIMFSVKDIRFIRTAETHVPSAQNRFSLFRLSN